MFCPHEHFPPCRECVHCAARMSSNHWVQVSPGYPPLVLDLPTWRPPELRPSSCHCQGISIYAHEEFHSTWNGWCSYSSHTGFTSNEAPHPSRLDGASMAFSWNSSGLQAPHLLPPSRLPRARPTSQAMSRYSRLRSSRAEPLCGPSRTERPERDSVQPLTSSPLATEQQHYPSNSNDRQALMIYQTPPANTSSHRRPSHSASQPSSSHNNSRTYSTLPPESSASNWTHNMRTMGRARREW